LELLDDAGVHDCLVRLGTPELLQKLSHKQCLTHLPAVISALRENLISDRLKLALGLLESGLSSPSHVLVSREFKEVLDPIKRG
jgi:hypothetical protein